MIEIHDITKTYGVGGPAPFTALKGISFTIENGEFVAIMGPSGSGKSTLMHSLGCLDTATSGTYRLDDVDVSALEDEQLADIRKGKIGFVFQAFNLLPRTSVIRNAMLPLVYDSSIPEGEREQCVREALHSVGINETHYNHKSNMLSGGQIQRVAIARALVNDPAMILADEPTGNLDTKTGEIVLSTFQRLNKEHNRTVILITHEHDVAEHAERIISLRDGVVVTDSRAHPRRHAKHHED